MQYVNTLAHYRLSTREGSLVLNTGQALASQPQPHKHYHVPQPTHSARPLGWTPASSTVLTKAATVAANEDSSPEDKPGSNAAAPVGISGTGRQIPAHKRKAVDRVCNAALEDLSRPFTLPDMAAQAHMSVRALQYAFQARFGLSPLNWLRQQRLELAHQRLLRGDFTNLALLAQECGLGAASRFTLLYRQQFGQLPSVTAGRRRRR